MIYRANYKFKFDPRIARRKRRLGGMQKSLLKLRKKIAFDFEFDSYLGLPAIKVKIGKDVLILREHGQVLLNEKIISDIDNNFQRGAAFFISYIKRSFPKKDAS